jgi:superfamily II DNA/RNA helicase
LEFSEFGLHPDLLDGLDALNFVKATPIQEQAIPIILGGRDLIGVAQTGTGKTAAFVLPLIHSILESGEADYVQALIVVPTRELAVQIDQVIEAYSYFTGVSSMAVYGGGDGKTFGQERTALSNGADIIVATPGRLIAHMNMGYVDFSRLRFLVLDEADRMLDMGFQPDLLKIIEALNPKRQSMLFSATMPQGVARLARTLLNNPETVSIALSKPAAGVKQGAFVVSEQQKLPLMVELLKDRTGQRIIVFGSTKQAVSKLYQKLRSRNMAVGQMSSDLEQEAREQVMLDFRNRKIDILVATDVVSRGIDVDGIDLVVNYDVPRDAEDYVHRVGRTARAERKGEALTLISVLDQPKFRKIETLIGSTIEKLPVPERLGPAPEYAPGKGGSGGGGRGGRSGGGGNSQGGGKRRAGSGGGRGHSNGPNQPKSTTPTAEVRPQAPADGQGGSAEGAPTSTSKSAARRRRRRGGRGKQSQPTTEN